SSSTRRPVPELECSGDMPTVRTWHSCQISQCPGNAHTAVRTTSAQIPSVDPLVEYRGRLLGQRTLAPQRGAGNIGVVTPATGSPAVHRPISRRGHAFPHHLGALGPDREEHTSELQSRFDL